MLTCVAIIALVMVTCLDKKTKDTVKAHLEQAWDDIKNNSKKSLDKVKGNEI